MSYSGATVPEFHRLPVSVDPADYALPDTGLDLDHTVARFEHTLIQRALERTGGWPVASHARFLKLS